MTKEKIDFGGMPYGDWASSASRRRIYMGWQEGEEEEEQRAGLTMFGLGLIILLAEALGFGAGYVVFEVLH